MAKSTIYKAPIMMIEEYWRNSYFSIARFDGGIRFQDNEYVICNKEGIDIFELSRLAEKEGREKAIEPGEPCDLVIRDWLPVYRAVGRERFMEIVESTNDIAEARRIAGIGRKKKGAKK